MDLQKIHLEQIDVVIKRRKEEEEQFFKQYQEGLITSLELANQILRLHNEELRLLKELKKIY